MDYEALKEQWSEVEDRDGARLSWNVFPSSRMVSGNDSSVEARCSHWSFIHTAEGETRYTIASIRASHMQTAMPLGPESVLVSD